MDFELSHLIEALPGLVWTAHTDGRAEFLNRRWCEYTGLRIDQAVGFGWQSALHPSDVTLVLQYWGSLLETGRSGEVEARLRRYDGEYRRFLFSAAPLFDKSGQVIKWCGTNTNIEERLKAQEVLQLTQIANISIERAQSVAALKESESRLMVANAHLTVAQRLSAMGSFTSDLLADEHTWSDEFYRICEFELGSKVTTQRLRDLIQADRHLFDAAIARAMNGQDVDFEFRIVTQSGREKHLHAAGRVSDHIDGRPVFMGAVHDITEKKLAEASLKAREAELRRALAHLTEAQLLSKTGSFTADLAKNEHIWSDGFYRICELDPAREIHTDTLGEFVLPEDLPSFHGAIERALSGEEPEFEFRIRTSRGVIKHLRGVAHRLAQDRPMFVGAVQDITESKLAEDALRKARAELAHAERVMTMGALTASIAHEVNQPLAGIITNATTCLSMLSADPPNVEGARVTVQRTLRDGNRASEVVNRLRAMFARRQPTNELLDLNETAREVLVLAASELQVCRVVLKPAFDPDLPPVSADRVQIQQVILNLVLNAADAMKTVVDRPRDLLIATLREGSAHVRFSVMDSGHGIDADNLERIFDVFYSTKSQGMGVGLAISRAIIESHQGRIWATANEGPGATFSFSIPLKNPHQSMTSI